MVATLFVVLLRLPFVGAMAEALFVALLKATRMAMRRARPGRVRPRNWSNEELRRFAGHYTGSVINVSGWRDADKAGGHYRDYFSSARSYAVSNFSGKRGTSDCDANDVFLDLEGEVAPELVRRYEVAFNHTVLEHIYDIRRAVANICALSDDTVILVTPFLQAVHYEEGAFGDYWRPSPMALRRMLKEEGFETIYQSSNDNPWYIVYVFTIATRHPERWKGKLPSGDADRTGILHFGLE